MDIGIASILAVDGLTTGAIYVLIAIGTVLIFTVTRVVFIPFGDIAAFTAAQDAILDALWPLLARGGRLLYATCSVFRDENDARADAFVARHADALRETLSLPHEVAHDGGAGDAADEADRESREIDAREVFRGQRGGQAEREPRLERQGDVEHEGADRDRPRPAEPRVRELEPQVPLHRVPQDHRGPEREARPGLDLVRAERAAERRDDDERRVDRQREAEPVARSALRVLRSAIREIAVAGRR